MEGYHRELASLVAVGGFAFPVYLVWYLLYLLLH
jgi:hypothetical protein